MIDGARYFSFDIINIFINFCVEFLLMFSHCCFRCIDVGDAQFFKAFFVSWQFGRKLCDMDWQGLDLYLFYSHFIEEVSIDWEFWWNIYGLFFLFVYLGTCISKFCKHIRYVFIQGFHIRSMFLSHGFDVIVNVIKVIF